ncbi:hypothetical protein EDB80DRAFT_679515 [Ilyonectria destructans]|nr:hypothetical protein EDB80DRAFT_679515 [Ilyonectria destructans]
MEKPPRLLFHSCLLSDVSSAQISVHLVDARRCAPKPVESERQLSQRYFRAPAIQQPAPSSDVPDTAAHLHMSRTLGNNLVRHTGEMRTTQPFHAPGVPRRKSRDDRASTPRSHMA